MENIECPYCGNKFCYTDGEDIEVDAVEDFVMMRADVVCHDCGQSFGLTIEFHPNQVNQ